MTFDAPDRFGDEPIIGWRCWLVHTRLGELWPIAHATPGPWQNPPVAAVCDNQDREAHPSPGLEHPLCGYHAYRQKRDAEYMLSWPRKWPKVIGMAALWGRVVEHSRGWRAQYAYPHAVWLRLDRELLRSHEVSAEEVCQRIRHRYGVENVGTVRSRLTGLRYEDSP